MNFPERKKVLTAAALTYVAGAASAILTAFANPDSDRWQKRRLDIEEIS